MTDRYDVCIVGAGPAGCALALKLAERRSVLILDHRSTAVPRIGESLHPDGRRLLADLGLLEEMIRQGHAPYHANRSVWGDNRAADMDFLRHPDGAGWHLDRARFDHWLRESAMLRGATVVLGARIGKITRRGTWSINFSDRTGSYTIAADFLVDAGGRHSAIARSLGVRRRSVPDDRLICGWVHLNGKFDRNAGITMVEATADGWWYAAPLPTRQRVLAFHTDRDLPAARLAADFERLPERARAATQEIRRMLPALAELEIAAKGYTAANGSSLEQVAGRDWLAVGDAALAMDPIAARGLLHALYMADQAALAVDRHLAGRADALAAYSTVVTGLTEEYGRLRRFAYAQETRFGMSQFWQRRAGQ